MTTFAPHQDGLGVWVAGKLVAVIPKDKLPALIYEAAVILRR